MTTVGLPDVVSALQTIATNSVPAGVLVFDGTPITDPPQLETYLVVGNSAAGSSPETGVDNDQWLGAKAQWDIYDVVGYVKRASGDLTYSADRTAVWAAWMAFRLAVQADETLGGLLTGLGWCRPASWSFDQTTEDDLDAGGAGAYAVLDFRFTVQDVIRLS